MKLHEAYVTHQEKISFAHVPIVEHFAQVLGWKPNHSSGDGIYAVNDRIAEERIRLEALLSNMLRLLGNVHKLWKARSWRWLKEMHSYKKSNKPNKMSLVLCVKHRCGRITWSTNGSVHCTHSFWCFAASIILEFNTYNWINLWDFK
jgi:hypothetical protein